MTDVFISYSRKDKPFVQRLFTALGQQGHNAWVDWDDIEYAEDWWQKIETGIAASDNFVFIMSPHSVRSKVCFDEVQYAEDTHKRIVPVVIQDIDDPVDQERIHPALKRHNWFLFRPEDDFNTAFTTLLEIIRRDPEYVKLHTRLLVNAQEWAANGKNHSLLLRGDNLRRSETWLQIAAEKKPNPTNLHTEYITTSRQAESRRRRRNGSVALFALVMIAVLTFVAWQLLGQNQRKVEERRSIAQAATAIEQLDDGNILTALAIAIEANQMSDPPVESINTLSTVAGSPAPRAISSSDTTITTLVMLPDLTRIVVGYADGSLKLWDATVGVGEFSTPLFITSENESHSGAINAVDVDADGHYVVSTACGQHNPESTEVDTCVEAEVFLWELVDDALVLRNRLAPQDNWSFMEGNAVDVAMKHDLNSDNVVEVGIAFTNAQGPIELRYSLDDSGNVTQPWAGFSRAGHTHNNMMTAITYNLDGDYLSGEIDGGLRYVQGLSGIGEGLSGNSRERVTALASSPDGVGGRSSRPFLIGYANGQIMIRSRNEIINNLDLGGPINDLDYNSDGNYALVALENGQLVLLDIANNATTKVMLRWQVDVPFTAVDYNDPIEGEHPDYAASGSADGTLILWDMNFHDLSEYDNASSLLSWIEENRYVRALTCDEREQYDIEPLCE